MAAVGLASRSQSSNSRRPKHYPEYYLPASPSVEDCHNFVDYRDEDQLPSLPDNSNNNKKRYARDRPQVTTLCENIASTSLRNHSVASRDNAAPTYTLQPPVRTTGVARRVLLRAKGVIVPHAGLHPVEQGGKGSSYGLADKSGVQDLQTSECVMSPFRYEQHRPPRSSRPSEARANAFISRVAQSSGTVTSDGTHGSTVPLHGTTTRTHNGPSKVIMPTKTSPHISNEDDIDSDFILQFAREHDLELGAEVARSLAFKTQNYESDQQQHASPLGGPVTTERRPFLSPDVETGSPATLDWASPVSSPRPPRPPKSAKRLSASPSPVTPTPPTPPPKTIYIPPPTTEMEPISPNADCPCAFDDADEEEVSCAQIPRQSLGYSRRLSASSTRPGRLRKERRISVGSRQTSRVHTTPKTPQTPVTPIDTQIEWRQADGICATTSTVRSQPIDLQSSPSPASELIQQFDDHTLEDFERNRRLSSLLKGLGIHSEPELPEAGPSHYLDSPVHSSTAPPSSSLSYTGAQRGSDGSPGASQVQVSVAPLSSDSFQTASESSLRIWEGEGYQSFRPEEPYDTDSLENTLSSTLDTRASNPGNSADPHLQDQAAKLQSEAAIEDLRWRQSHLPEPLPPETDIDTIRRSLIDQRASLGITDSVLASILAADSFYMPHGARLSMEQIAARLSMEQRARRSRSGSVQRSSTRGSLNSNSHRSAATSTGGATGRFSSNGMKDAVDIPAEAPLSAVRSPSIADEQNSLPQLGALSNIDQSTAEDNVEVVNIEDATDALESEDALPRSQSREGKASWRQSTLSVSEALALRPLPLELPEPEIENPRNVSRRRTRSSNAFQRLSNTFSGSSSKARPSRKRLSSFLSVLAGGNKSVPQGHLDSKHAIPTRDDSPEHSISPHLPAMPVKPGRRKRAMTGPAKLRSIVNTMTNPVPDMSSHVDSTIAQQAHEDLGQLPTASDSWRSTLPDHVFASLAKSYGRDEFLRQEVIHELYKTEDSFVSGLKGVVRVFSQPLRTSNGRWISGVPTTISRLLDWLDDIVYLHSQLTAALQDCRYAQGHLVYRLAEVILEFIPRLEVHLPYLVRFDAVTHTINDMLVKSDSDFGEFVRMQQALPECGSMSLTSFLLKPVQRLMKYPLFFKQLCDLTPIHHPDYMATRELMAATDLTIRAMQEVKGKEEEYETLRMLSTKLLGLPTGFTLARRDRHLLASGNITLIEFSDTEKQSLELHRPINSTGVSSSIAVASHTMVASRYVPHESPASQPRTGDSNLFISPRPMSYYSDMDSSAPSLSTGYSASSAAWESQSFSPPFLEPTSGPQSRSVSPSTHSSSLFRPLSVVSSLRPDSLVSIANNATAPPLPSKGTSQSFHTETIDNHYTTMSPAASGTSSNLKSILKKSPSIALVSRSKPKRKETLAHIFVFSDILIFTSGGTIQAEYGSGNGLSLRPSKSSLKSLSISSGKTSKKDAKEKYAVLDDWGVARIIGLTDLSGQTELPSLYKLELLPLWRDEDADRPFTLTSASFSTTMYLSLPEQNVTGKHTALASSPLDIRSGLQQSYLRSLQNMRFQDQAKDAGSQNAATITKRSASRLSVAKTVMQRGSSDMVHNSKTTASHTIPRSPSQQQFPASIVDGDNADSYLPTTPSGWEVENDYFDHDVARSPPYRSDDAAEREERAFWSMRFRQVRAEMTAGSAESLVAAMDASGLLHYSQAELEQVIAHVNAQAYDAGSLLSPELIAGLRQVKVAEKRLKDMLLESKKGVVRVGSANSIPVGLAISYDERELPNQQQGHHHFASRLEQRDSGASYGSGIDNDHYCDHDNETDQYASGSEYDSDEDEEELGHVLTSESLTINGGRKVIESQYTQEDNLRHATIQSGKHIYTHQAGGQSLGSTKDRDKDFGVSGHETEKFTQAQAHVRALDDDDSEVLRRPTKHDYGAYYRPANHNGHSSQARRNDVQPHHQESRAEGYIGHKTINSSQPVYGPDNQYQASTTRGMTPSPSLETVYTVQRAKRVPITSRR